MKAGPKARSLAPYRWWGHMNAVRWQEDYPKFVEWFISRCFTEKHSTKGIEDGVEWGLETDPATLAATTLGQSTSDRGTLRELARASSARCW